MLQGRLFSYHDTHLHRLGTNYTQIPINCPYATRVKNYQRDGPMVVDDNQGMVMCTVMCICIWNSHMSYAISRLWEIIHCYCTKKIMKTVHGCSLKTRALALFNWSKNSKYILVIYLNGIYLDLIIDFISDYCSIFDWITQCSNDLCFDLQNLYLILAGAPNYYPNSFTGPVDNKKYMERREKFVGDVARSVNLLLSNK